MSALPFDPLPVITTHSEALYDAAESRLDLPAASCPGWTVADLVAHLTGVHWFWATIVEDLLAEPPTDHPARVPDDQLLEAGRAQAGRLVRVLAADDPSASCWTWAPTQKDAGFVVRHQVQEAAVHHWDAADATGTPWAIDPVVAADCVDEFLTFSVASEHYPADVQLGGTFCLQAADTGGSWAITDGLAPGTLGVTRGTTDGPALRASAPELLLWLYRRAEIDAGEVPAELLQRFRAMSSTD